MRRIKFVFAALAIVVTSLAAYAGPAMADDLNCRDARGKLIRCDGRLYEPANNNRFYNDYNPYAFYNDYYGYGFDDEIPVWTGYGWCEYDLDDNEYDC